MKQLKIKGFTLIELMVVVAIIAILAAIAIPMIFQYRVSANRAKCIGNMKQIQNMVEARKAAKGGKLSTDIAWADTGLIHTQTGYFKATPVCPQNNAPYSLSGSSSDTWRPNCTNTDEPYLHKFPEN